MLAFGHLQSLLSGLGAMSLKSVLGEKGAQHVQHIGLVVNYEDFVRLLRHDACGPYRRLLATCCRKRQFLARIIILFGEAIAVMCMSQAFSSLSLRHRHL